MSGLAQSARLRDRPERRYVVGGYSIWIHGSATRNETRNFSKVGLFRSCAPDRPTLEKRRVKAGPTQISKQIYP